MVYRNCNVQSSESVMMQMPGDKSSFPRTKLGPSAASLAMGGMDRCDQMGIYEALGNMLRSLGHFFPAPRSSIDPAVDDFAVLSHLRSRYLEARSLEAKYGRGALLNLDHRDVAMMVERRQLLYPAEIEAARAFRDANEAFYLRWRDDAATMPSESRNGPAIWIPLGS